MIAHQAISADAAVRGPDRGADLVRRIEPPGGPARFDGRPGDGHHHVACRSCGTVADVDCVVAPCLKPASTAGFRVYEADVTFWGLCPDCRTDRPEAAPYTPKDLGKRVVRRLGINGP